MNLSVSCPSTIGLVCRFKPVHRIHGSMLRALCRTGAHVRIGIGSSNRYDLRNPFTLAETRDMIDAVLRPRFRDYDVVAVPDLGHGPRWRAQVLELFGPLDLFVSANDYVRSLMDGQYRLAHPRDLIPADELEPIDGTRVRRAMARGEEWKDLVPPAVLGYLQRNDLPERFRREFGLATLIDEIDQAGCL